MCSNAFLPLDSPKFAVKEQGQFFSFGYLIYRLSRRWWRPRWPGCRRGSRRCSTCRRSWGAWSAGKRSCPSGRRRWCPGIECCRSRSGPGSWSSPWPSRGSLRSHRGCWTSFQPGTKKSGIQSLDSKILSRTANINSMLPRSCKVANYVAIIKTTPETFIVPKAV